MMYENDDAECSCRNSIDETILFLLNWRACPSASWTTAIQYKVNRQLPLSTDRREFPSAVDPTDSDTLPQSPGHPWTNLQIAHFDTSLTDQSKNYSFETTPNWYNTSLLDSFHLTGLFAQLPPTLRSSKEFLNPLWCSQPVFTCIS